MGQSSQMRRGCSDVMPVDHFEMVGLCRNLRNVLVTSRPGGEQLGRVLGRPPTPPVGHPC